MQILAFESIVKSTSLPAIAILKTIGPHVKIYLADFLKTNVAKFAAWLKKGQKAGFLRPISSKFTLAKEKERRIKLRGREEEGGEGKEAMAAL